MRHGRLRGKQAEVEWPTRSHLPQPHSRPVAKQAHRTQNAPAPSIHALPVGDTTAGKSNNWRPKNIVSIGTHTQALVRAYCGLQAKGPKDGPVASGWRTPSAELGSLPHRGAMIEAAGSGRRLRIAKSELAWQRRRWGSVAAVGVTGRRRTDIFAGRLDDLFTMMLRYRDHMGGRKWHAGSQHLHRCV